MDYKKVYLSIIKKAKKENRIKSKDIYYETHHVLPKSIFPRWRYRKSNLVLLTPREHYFCHELLIKIYPGRSMNYALWFMSNSKEYSFISSKQYERAKKLNYKNSLGETNPNYGNKWSNEQKIEASKRATAQINLYGNPNFGNKWSDTQKKSLANKKLGRSFYTNGEIDICVFDCDVPDGFYKGHVKSFKGALTEKALKSIKKTSERNKGRHWYNNGIKNAYTYTCPEGYSPGMISRWSEESLESMKKKNSESHKGKVSRTIGVKELNSGFYFDSMKAAAEFFNIDISYVSNLANNRRTSKKFKFKIID